MGGATSSFVSRDPERLPQPMIVGMFWSRRTGVLSLKGSNDPQRYAREGSEVVSTPV